jgi:hypothetical protein
MRKLCPILTGYVIRLGSIFVLPFAGLVCGVLLCFRKNNKLSSERLSYIVIEYMRIIQEPKTKLNSVALVRKRIIQPSNRRMLEKLVPTFADRGCCVVSAADPNGRKSRFSRPGAP